ncbi:GDSL esterase/lipase [Rhynchospora pubera]|uniref:GDSL esterase/lipase n=1 Tax=Rhynchospora pubera TaxID=906938 RepID=A0AAV8HUD7_9POAL|nr:GDSL esterase/lipase [Rhynchospora pubera]
MKSSPQFSLLCLLFSFVAKAVPLIRTKHVNAIFSFGDSYADTGNFAVLASPVLNDTIWTSKPPYGETFFHGPNGRCSDGRLVIDFIADEMGLPLLPPYLSHNESFSRGANFAVSGATALDFEFFVKNNLTSRDIINSSLRVQLSWFDEFKPSLCSTPGDCWDYFGKSLFVLGEIGGNDYAYMLFFGWSVEQTMAYVPHVISVISSAVEMLINEGATAIVIPGTWPAGCAPINLAINMNASIDAYEPQTGCIKALNELHRSHNIKLRFEITKLRLRYPHIALIYTDYYSLTIDFLLFPERFGFIRAPLMACCGNGNNQYNINLTEACGMPGVSACQDPSTYVSWDGAHMTEAAYRYIASSWLRGPYADPPILLALRD